MYTHNQNQLEFEDFFLPFGGRLRSDNRWVKLAKIVPWDEFEKKYKRRFKSQKFGPPAKSVRIALGALIIKEKLGTSDEETVEQITENPYLQYFLGLKAYTDQAPFHPTMFVHFRKRLNRKIISEMIEKIARQSAPQEEDKKDDDKDDDGDDSSGKSSCENKGKLLIDATCAPSDIAYPTDLKLLNNAREKSERIIDMLHASHKGLVEKPRTYRKKARKDFLKFAKSKRLSKQKRRSAVRKQIGYLKRNLKHIDHLSKITSLSVLEQKQYRELLVIKEVLRQQQWMYEKDTNRIDDRIVSISQPHVRPIKRGKANASTEFGAKLSVSLVDGYCYLDRLDWNNYNEALDLMGQIESYKTRFGFYPKSVHVDKIYRNRDNIRFCKSKGIRISGARLGRPPKDQSKQKELSSQAWRDEVDRIPIEGKFGQAKRRFSLGRIMCKLSETSEAAIAMVFFVMNLEKRLKEAFLLLLKLLFELKKPVSLIQKATCDG